MKPISILSLFEDLQMSDGRPANKPKKAKSPTGITKNLIKLDTMAIIINPPNMFPNKRKEWDTTLDIAPIIFR